MMVAYAGVLEIKQAAKQMAAQKRGGRMPRETFGKRVRILRIEKDLSQIQLRDQMAALGVPIGETYISELERTAKMPSLEVAAAMAQVLEVSVDYLALLIDDPLPITRQPVPDAYLSEEADAIAAIVDGMHPSQRALLLGVAKNMANAPTVRQRERAEIRDILDSIERDKGRAMRLEIEKSLRRKGLLIDPDI